LLPVKKGNRVKYTGIRCVVAVERVFRVRRGDIWIMGFGESGIPLGRHYNSSLSHRRVSDWNEYHCISAEALAVIRAANWHGIFQLPGRFNGTVRNMWHWGLDYAL